jgi:hypothetical protein
MVGKIDSTAATVSVPGHKAWFGIYACGLASSKKLDPAFVSFNHLCIGVAAGHKAMILGKQPCSMPHKPLHVTPPAGIYPVTQ